MLHYFVQSTNIFDKNRDFRSAYTRRIYEIIGNISKQNNEIQKILKDTRALQKEIKTLTEQIDRSFTLADELLFHVSTRK